MSNFTSRDKCILSNDLTIRVRLQQRKGNIRDFCPGILLLHLFNYILGKKMYKDYNYWMKLNIKNCRVNAGEDLNRKY